MTTNKITQVKHSENTGNCVSDQEMCFMIFTVYIRYIVIEGNT